MSETSERNAAKRKAADVLTQPVEETTEGTDSRKMTKDDEITDSVKHPEQCSDIGQEQPQTQTTHQHSTSAKDEADQLELWTQVLKDQVVNNHLTEYIDASDMLVYFYYMPRPWADKIKAVHKHEGRSRGAQEFIDHLLKLADDDHNWYEDLRSGLQQSGHPLLVELLDEKCKEVKSGANVPDSDPLQSSQVEGQNENYKPDFTPSARAICQHHDLWIRTFREKKKQIIECVEPTAVLPYLPYLPKDRIRAECENHGVTRGADVLVESLFQFSDRSWMKDFVEALRAPRINQRLIADMLVHHFHNLVEKTKTNPKYEDFHVLYSKAQQNSKEIGTKHYKLLYFGPRQIKDSGAT